MVPVVGMIINRSNLSSRDTHQLCPIFIAPYRAGLEVAWSSLINGLYIDSSVNSRRVVV